MTVATAPWYTNPAWYALGIAILSLIVSAMAMRTVARGTKSQIQRDLIVRANEINEAFLSYKVKGPYAHHLKIPDAQVESFTAKAILLLYQINLLRDVYDHRDVLDEDAVKAYQSWASTILRPWIEADSELVQVWKLTRDSTDMVGKDFMEWLRPLLPII
ncbi:MAG: hypothetical protein HYZ50_06535 [Deltaproteobacteria bacterium]|nr:hypothetical protein [Deltaproteobacteria bacterium]